MSDENSETEDELNPKNRGLGRGLNALFDDDEVDFAGEEVVAELESAILSEPEQVRQELPARLGVDQLKPGRYQPRTDFDEESLEQLAQSIRNHGVLQPLLVQKLDGGPDDVPAGLYEIVAGERRWRAAQMAQIHDVPVVHVKFDDAQTLEVALTENLQREDLGPLEEAYAYQQLMEEFGQTQEQLATSLGKSRSYIANMVRLLGAPDTVQAALRDGYISIGHARAMLSCDNPHDLLEKVVDNGLSVRDTEKLAAGEVIDKPSIQGDEHIVVSGIEPNVSRETSSAGNAKDPNIAHLEQELSVKIGMRVHIDDKSGKGALRIEYQSLDQLDDVIARLAQIPGQSKLMG